MKPGSLMIIISVAALCYTHLTFRLMQHDVNNRNRPAIGIDHFDLQREKDSIASQQLVTVHLKNYGTVPANNVKLYLTTYETSAHSQATRKWIYVDNISLMPSQSITIDKEDIENAGFIESTDEKEVKILREILANEVSHYARTKMKLRAFTTFVNLNVEYTGIGNKKNKYYIEQQYNRHLSDTYILTNQWRVKNSYSN